MISVTVLFADFRNWAEARGLKAEFLPSVIAFGKRLRSQQRRGSNITVRTAPPTETPGFARGNDNGDLDLGKCRVAGTISPRGSLRPVHMSAAR